MTNFRGRIRERDLIVPTLRAANSRKNGFIATSDLIDALEAEFQPQGEDAKILDGRNDSKFSQIVRNLKSHKNSGTSIFKKGYAEEIGDGLRITDAGRSFLSQFPE